ncbi:MAG: hypothetical protein HWD92_10205 [Flavobacteriia bacterium]|nr:hypothetical protein [Flavobacteriia bacterium]
MKKIVSILILTSLSAFTWAQLPDVYEPMSRPSSGRVDSSSTTTNSTRTSSAPASFEDRSFAQRLVYGGNLQLSFGSFTVIEVSPRVGYRITEDLIGGLGANFMYIRYGENFFYNGSPSLDYTIWGGNTFASYSLPFGLPLAVQGEYELLNFEVFNPTTFEEERQWVPALRFGGGYFQPINNRGGGVYFVALYDFLWDQDVSFNRRSPWTLRASFFF